MANKSRGLSASNGQWIKNNKWKIQDLPAPHKTWHSGNVDIPDRYITTMSQRGIIKRVESYTEGDVRKTVYRTKMTPFDRLHDYLENPNSLLPCGHGGFKNPRDIDGVRCTVCESEFAKSEVDR